MSILGFEIILTHVLEIKQQNKRIINILERQESAIHQELPDDVPVQFPIKTEENLNLLEEYLVSSENVKGIVRPFELLPTVRRMKLLFDF